MTTAKELAGQISTAMEGVTDGPWHVDPKAAEESFFEDVNILRHDGLAVAVCVHNGDILPPEPEKNAAYIAATQPDNMRIILSALADAERERNVFKAKSISRGKLLDRFRTHVQEICDHATDEIDRAYFGSTNHLEDLRDIVREMDMWKWDTIIKQRDETDPYAEIRSLRARATAAEAKLAEAVKVIEPFAEEAKAYEPDTGDGDDIVWATPVYFKIKHLRAARSFLSKLEASHAEA